MLSAATFTHGITEIQWQTLSRAADDGDVSPEEFGGRDPAGCAFIWGVKSPVRGTGSGTLAMRAFIAEHPEGIALQAYPLDMNGPDFAVDHGRLGFQLVGNACMFLLPRE
jgi:hypothetical protein